MTTSWLKASFAAASACSFPKKSSKGENLHVVLNFLHVYDFTEWEPNYTDISQKIYYVLRMKESLGWNNYPFNEIVEESESLNSLQFPHMLNV